MLMQRYTPVTAAAEIAQAIFAAPDGTGVSLQSAALHRYAIK